MTFTGLELSAIVKLGLLMSMADGKVDDTEQHVIILELLKFGMTENQAKAALIAANAMEFTDAAATVKNMTSTEKKHVVSFLGALIAADGKIADEEVKLCTLVSLLCGLPEISAGEAIVNWLAD
jgi:uncharacterized tellurite resistance protein B-like protein